MNDLPHIVTIIVLLAIICWLAYTAFRNRNECEIWYGKFRMEERARKDQDHKLKRLQEQADNLKAGYEQTKRHLDELIAEYNTFRRTQGLMPTNLTTRAGFTDLGQARAKREAEEREAAALTARNAARFTLSEEESRKVRDEAAGVRRSSDNHWTGVAGLGYPPAFPICDEAPAAKVSCTVTDSAPSTPSSSYSCDSGSSSSDSGSCGGGGDCGSSF